MKQQINLEFRDLTYDYLNSYCRVAQKTIKLIEPLNDLMVGIRTSNWSIQFNKPINVPP